MQKSNEAYDARELSKFNIWQYEVKLLNIADMFTKTRTTKIPRSQESLSTIKVSPMFLSRASVIYERYHMKHTTVRTYHGRPFHRGSLGVTRMY